MARNITKTIGCDLGDKHSHVCVLNGAGEVEGRARFATSQAGFSKWFKGIARSRVALEVGTHSRWVAELLTELGHEVIVANARQVRLIHQGQRKNDKLDAEKLSRLARVDRQLLSPVRHRSQEAQSQLAVLPSRDQLVQARTELINHVRGVSKSFGIRIAKCTSAGFTGRVERTAMPQSLLCALQPLLAALQALNQQIKVYETLLEDMAQRCKQVQPLLTIHGVGALTAMAFVLTLDDPTRFISSRGFALGWTHWSQPVREIAAPDEPDPLLHRGASLRLVECEWKHGGSCSTEAARQPGPEGQDQSVTVLDSLGPPHGSEANPAGVRGQGPSDA